MGAGVVFILSLSASLGSTLYSLNKTAHQTLDDMYGLIRSRGENVALSLGEIAGENPGAKRRVTLSETMRQIVENSYRHEDPFPVEEIFLINRRGRLIAHNDVPTLARGSGVSYESKEYLSILESFRGNAVEFTIVEQGERPSGFLKGLLFDYFHSVNEGLTAGRYHVAAAVFPPDVDRATSAIHMMIRNNYTFPLFDRIIRSLGAMLLTGMVLSVIAAGLAALVLMMLFGEESLQEGAMIEERASRERALPEVHSLSEDEEILLDLPEEIMAYPAGERLAVPVYDHEFEVEVLDKQTPQETGLKPKILDAIPLDHEMSRTS